ncbi:hypothetical protein HDZ31DRAFT_19849, partial [Schizophyllum fasciatum]
NHWRPVFPARWNANRRPSRTVILVNANIDTNAWRPIIVPDTHDITAIQMETNAGRLNLFNIY